MDVEVQLFECDSCHLEFKQKSTFLRHVSHKKVCKSYYGESRLNDMTIEGKLSAKRKWWQRHADEAKKSYQTQWGRNRLLFAEVHIRCSAEKYNSCARARARSIVTRI